MTGSATSTVGSRMTALGLLALVLAGAAWAVAVPFVEALRAAQEHIETQRRLLGGYEAVSSSRPQDAEDRLRRIQSAVASVRVGGDTAAIAAGNLQTLVREVAAEIGIRVNSSRVLPAAERDGVALMGVRVELGAPLSSAQQLLYEIERRKPWLLVDALEITARREDGPVEVAINIFAAHAPFGDQQQPGVRP